MPAQEKCVDLLRWKALLSQAGEKRNCGFQGQGYKESSFFALQVLLLSSHQSITEELDLQGKGMEGGGYDNCLTGKKGSTFPIPHEGMMCDWSLKNAESREEC